MRISSIECQKIFSSYSFSKNKSPVNAEYCAYFAMDTNGKIVAIKVTTNNYLYGNYRYHYTIELDKPAEKFVIDKT